MRSCNSCNDGERSLCTSSLRLDEVNPNPQTVLHFQGSPQDQIVQEEAFTDHRGCFSLGAAGVQVWIIPNNTRQRWDDGRGRQLRQFKMMSSRGWLPRASSPGQSMAFLSPLRRVGQLSRSNRLFLFFFWFKTQKLSQARAHQSPREAFPRPVPLCVGEVGCRNVRQPKVSNFVTCRSHSCSDYMSVALVILQMNLAGRLMAMEVRVV